MGALGDRLALETLSPPHWIGIALAAVTGLVHLVLGIGFLPHWMGLAFIVAAAGFAVGIALVLADVYRRYAYLAGIPFTAGQIVIWYDVNRPAGVADLTAVEVVDKVAQVLLIAVLVVLYRRE